MRRLSLTIAAMCFLGAAHASPPLTFDYLVTGSENLRPTLVFHDGENTYVEPPDNISSDSISVMDASSEQYGPYLLIKGIPKSFLMTAKIGKKTETVKIVYQGPPRSIDNLQPIVRAPEPQKAAKVPTPIVGASPSTDVAISVSSSPSVAGCQTRILRNETAFLVGFDHGSSKVSQVLATKILAAIGNLTGIESVFILAGEGPEAQARASALKTTVEKSGVLDSKIQIGTETNGQLGTELRIVRAKVSHCDSGGMRIEAPHRGAVTVVAKGDALEILKMLADKLGMLLVVEGSEVKLPISVNEVEKPLVLVLDRIGKAINPQADLIIRASELVIRYRKGKS